MKTNSKTIIKGTLFMLIGKGVHVTLLLLINMLIGRFFGAGTLGTYSIVTTIFLLFSTSSLFGFFRTVNRFAPEYRKKGNEKGMRELAGTALKFPLTVSIIFCVLIVLSSTGLSRLFEDPQLETILRVFMLGLPFFTLMRLIVAFATSFETTKFEALIDNILFPVITFISLIILYNLGNGENSISNSYLFAYISTFLIALLLTKFSKVRRLKLGKSLKYFNWKYIVYSLPIFVHSILYLLMKWFDTFALGYFHSSEEVGIYNASLKIAALPTILLLSVNTIFLPTISRLISTGQMQEMKTIYRDIIRLLTIITLPISIFTIVFGQDLISIFGSDFKIQQVLMIILVIGAFLNIFSGPIDFCLTALDKQKLIMLNSLFALAANVVINIILTPSQGIIGAAIANTTAIVIQNYLGIFELYLLTKFSPYKSKLFTIIGIGLLSGLLLQFAKTNVQFLDFETTPIFSKILWLGILGVGFYIIFLLLVFVLRLYESKDKSLVLEIFDKLIHVKK